MPLSGLDPAAAGALVAWHEAAWALAAVLLGYVTLGLAGFGSALVVVPLLSWHWPLALVVPLVLLIDVPASMLHAGLNLRTVAWGEIPRLVPAMVAGSLLGAALLAWATSAWPLLLLLGIYIVGVGLRGLRPAAVAAGSAAGAAAAPTGARAAWLAGLGMGVIESMFGVAGPVVVAWLSRRLRDPLALRATVPPTIVIVALLAIGSAALAGQLRHALLWAAWLALLPLALLGVALGHRVARRLPPRRVGRVVFSLLILSGLAMAVRSVVALAAA